MSTADAIADARRGEAGWSARAGHVIAGTLVAVLVSGALARAQGAADRPLSLPSAVDQALAANPTLTAARLARAVSAADLGVLSERPNPEFSAEFTRETPKQAFGLAVPLELGGKRARRLEVGQAGMRTSEAEIAATTAQVRNAVRRAYFGVLVADARVALLDQLTEIAGRVLESATLQFEAGSVPRLEVMQAELARASAESEAESAQGTAAAARSRLNVLLGEPLDTRWRLVTEIDTDPNVTAEAMLDLASSASAEIALIDRRIEQQQARLQLAQALRVPDVVPAASLTRQSAPEFDYGWRAGVTLTLPVLTTHRSGVTLEQAVLDQLRAERTAALRGVTGSVTAAAAVVNAQRQRYVRYRDEIVPQAQRVEQVAQDAYDLGQTGIVALLQALQATRDVRLRALDAVAEFQGALAELESAIGAPLP